MINYIDPARWIVLQYRPGAGGKMLLLCLMTIESIAHWDPEVDDGTIAPINSLHKYWNISKSTHWISTEPLVHWHSKFYSRSYARGDDIELDEYNSLMNRYADNHFKKCWNSGKLLLDFSHKSPIPKWHNGSLWLKLGANPNDQIYKKILLSKLFPWDPITGIGTCLPDKPVVNQSENVLKFDNQFEFGPFNNSDEWYDFIWNNYRTLKFDIENPDIMFQDLLDIEKVEKFVKTIANRLKSKYNANDLYAIHDYWLSKQATIIKT